MALGLVVFVLAALMLEFVAAVVVLVAVVGWELEIGLGLVIEIDGR